MKRSTHTLPNGWSVRIFRETCVLQAVVDAPNVKLVVAVTQRGRSPLPCDDHLLCMIGETIQSYEKWGRPE